MATENPGSTSGLFGGVMGSGRGVKPRAEYPTESGGHTAVPGADGNFLGNVHLGRGVNPDAHADTVTAAGNDAPAGGPAPDTPASSGSVPVAIPPGGLPVELPLVPSFPGVSIAVQVAGLPENTVLSSGHAMSSGGWQLDMAETPGLRLVPAAGAGDNTFAGPAALDVSYVVTNNATGESRVVQLGPVSAVADADTAANTVSESAADGDSVGINAAASDPDSYDRVIYTLLDDAGGRFAIDPLTGEVTVKDASLLDYETATSHTIVVQAESTDGSKTTATFTIALTDDNTEFSVTPVADTDAAADGISETASNGDVVGVTAFASDGDATDTVTYSLTDDAGGRFTIDATTGVVTVADASLLDYETATSHTIAVQATSTDGSTETKTFTISLADDTSEFAVTPVADADAAENGVSESASNGDTVGITAFASDGDATDTVTYSLTDDAGGRFAIDVSTGVVTVADASLLDYETATSHSITVQATSTDGSTETQDFTIALSDDTSEFSISKIADADATKNRVSESTTDGTVVGVTAFASDADGSDTVTYSLTNDAGGRFAVDATTGVVTVADASLLDYETAKSHKITVLATSSDGSTATKSFTINIADDRTEFHVSAVSDADASANTVSESASNGDTVGVTAFADDADGSDKVTYKLLDNAGGRFAIDSKSGVVTVANASLLDYETATGHEITVQAKSSDGSIQTQTFTIALSDDTGEYSVTPVADTNTAADGVSESASNGDLVGITAFASDADGSDTVTYSLTDDAGGRFAIDATTGVVTVADASLLDYETANSHTITVQAASSDGSTETKTFTIVLSDDTSEFSVSPVADADAAADSVSESATNGDVVGVTAFASDGDATDTITYSLTDDAGGRFAIDTATGVVTVADASLLDYETATSHTITVQATSTDGSTQTQTFTIALADDTSEFAVTPVADTDAATDGVSESASNGDTVGITAFASDADGSDAVTYSLTDDAGGRFAIDASTGMVTVADASLLDYETATSHTITVQATSSDGSTEAKTFTIALSDDTSEFSVAPVADTDAAADTVSEGASNGDTVGVTAFANDADATDTVTYSLSDDAGGRFAIDAATGVVTVADASLLDYETATSHTITVQATSSDGSTEAKTFTIALADDTSEFTVSAISDTNAAADGISEAASNGDTVGITAFASDADGSDAVSYSLTDDAGGRFAIDAAMGVVTVADASQLDYETATSHTITVQATSTDGSTATQDFTIALSDDTGEFVVSAVSDSDTTLNAVAENASDGDVVGVTAFASDGDATDSVTYSLTDDAGGRFGIDATTGQVTVADGSLLDYETAASHTITVQATSSDGSTATQTFTIAVTDVNEAPTGGSVHGPSPAAGAALHLDATDIDADGGTGNNPGNGSAVSRWDDSSGGNHDAVQLSSAPVVASGAINGKDAIDFSGANAALQVGDTSAINLGTVDERSYAIAFQTGDDVSGFQVVYEEGGTVRGYSLSIAADPANGGQPTLWAFVWNTAEWGSGDQYKAINLGPVAANETYSVVMVHDATAASLADRTFSAYVNGDYAGSVGSVGVQYAHSGDIGVGGYLNDTLQPVTHGSLSGNGGEFAGKVGEVLIWNAALDPQQVSETSSYLNEKWGGAPSVGEDAPNGTAVFAVADIVDPDGSDTYTYSLVDDAGGRFAVDASTGVVTVADASLIDYETAQSHAVTVRVTDAGGNTLEIPVTIDVGDGNDALGAVSDTDAAADGVSESASNGDVVGITAFASDADAGDTVTYSLADDAGGRFAIDAATGVVTVADASLLDYETATSHTITVQATSTDGSTQAQSFTIALSDDTSEFSVSAVLDTDASPNTVSESASNGDVVGVTAFASDADASDTVTYSLTDDAGGRFAIDATSGMVTVADASLLDYETVTSHTITVQATSSDGSTQTQAFSIAVSDDTSEFSVSSVSDTDASANTVTESASNGDVVGITAFASDADASDTVTYSLTDDAGGRFVIDAGTGVVTVADASLLDYETATSHTITVQATSSDGSTQAQTFTVALSDDTSEFSVSAVLDTDASPNTVSESASNGDVVGVTAFASDADASDTVTYSLTDDAGGRFAIDATTGQVTVADASLLDYETATSHSITVQATSSDGSTQAQSFTIALSDDTGEFSVSAVSDTDASANTVSESASNGDVVGVTAFASDADAGDTVTYSLSDDAGGRFAIDATTGQVTVADASLLDYETATSHAITVQATSTDGSTQTQSFTIALSDDTSEFSVSAVSDMDSSTNTVSESASNGDVVGLTAFASDSDGTDTATYSLTDDVGGRFAIDAATGVVTVADASLLDYETATSHTVTVQATSSDGSTSTQDFTIDVANTVEAATVTTSDSTGNEDSAIALDIQLADLDGGATNTITISGVPSGATLSAGTDMGGGSWTLTPAQVSGLTVTPPADSDTDFQLSVTVTSDDGAQTVTTSAQTIDVTVDAVADAPILTVTDGPTQLVESTFESGASGSGFVDGSIDGWSPGAGNQIEFWSENDVPGNAYEGHEFIELNYEGSGTYPDAGIIERTISTTADATYDLTFEVSARPGFESYMDFKVSAVDLSSGDVLETVTVNWDGNTVSSLTWQEHSLQFTGTGGDVQLVFEDIGAVHDYGRGAYIDDIQLSETINYTSGDTVDMSPLISVGLSDGDGSETLGTVEIANIPTGAVMAVDGTPLDAVNGAVSVTTSQLSGLTFTAPEGFSGDLTFDITATSTETSNGDSASTTDSLTLSFKSDDENLDDRGSSSNSHLNGNGSDNTLYGGAGNDTINGRSGDDLLYGGSGDDTLSGSKGDDALLGGDGNDTLRGGSGDDFLYGGSGDDKLYGDSGNDTLYGGEGNDQLDGGSGDDRISGGLGNDTATGGDGNDIYIYSGGNDSFAGGGGAWTDTIQLSGVDGVDAYNGWTVSSDVTVTSSGDGYIDLAADSDGTITMDDGSQLTFTDVDRIEW